MISFTSKGNFKKTRKQLNKLLYKKLPKRLEKYGQWGIDALSKATPIDTGETAASWDYQIESTSTGYIITWINTNMAGNTSVALLLQYGHGTRDGYFVEGIDYVNPAMIPVMEKISNDLWKEMHKL